MKSFYIYTVLIQITLILFFQAYTFGLYSSNGSSLLIGKILPFASALIISSLILAGFIKLLFRKKASYSKSQFAFFLVVYIAYNILIQTNRNSHISGDDKQLHQEMSMSSNSKSKKFANVYLKRYNKNGINFFSQYRYPGEPFFSRPNRVKPKNLKIKDLITNLDILNSPELMYRIGW